MSEGRGPLKLTHLPLVQVSMKVNMKATVNPSATVFPSLHTTFPYLSKVVPTIHYYFFLFPPMLKIDFKTHGCWLAQVLLFHPGVCEALLLIHSCSLYTSSQ